MKTCSKCGENKDGLEFYRKVSGKGGFQAHCKICDKEKSRIGRVARMTKDPEKVREEKREYARKFQVRDAERHREAVRNYRARNLELSRQRSRQNHIKNREKELEQRRRARENNLGVARKYDREKIARRRKEEPDFKLLSNLRVRLNSAVKRADKSARTQELLGCPVSWLQVHLESLFKPGMTWSNHGPVWHIDHIKPCAVFDLTDPEQQRICFHWTNLQPLFAADNLRKSDTYASPELQPTVVV